MKAGGLADALRAAVLRLGLEAIRDPQDADRPLRHFPSLDLAVVGFPAGDAPLAAQLHFSREHPLGLITPAPPAFGALNGLHVLADLQDGAQRSIAWDPDADWSALPFETLAGQPGQPRVVAPYPASLLKLMLAVGVALACSQGRADYGEAWAHEGQRRPLRDWQFDMLAVSCNRSTSALVAWLHARGELDATGEPLEARFRALGLPTLRLRGTRPDGGWGNAAGAGVGRIQMTAWDTLRLLWWLDPDAPPPPWVGPDAPTLGDAARGEVLRGLQLQGLDTVLSGASLAGLPGAPRGLPSRLNGRWIRPDGGLRAGDYDFPPDVRATHASAQLRFAHKIGSTENYAADAGIVQALAPARRHYLVALLSNLGRRYAWHPLAAGPRQLAELGATIDRLMARALEAA
jgi:hypothetical protein